MRKTNNRLAAMTVLAALAGLTTTATESGARDWFYYSFGEQIPLTLDANAIAIFDPTPAPVIGKRMIPTPHGALPAEALAADWAVLDLSGTPSGGDPDAIEALIESLASDPTTDDFVSPVFTTSDGIFKVVSPNVLAGFQEGVPEATVLADLADASLGAIVDSGWLRPNVFIVEGASRSGITVLDRANSLAVGPDLNWATVDWMIYGDVVHVEAGSPLPLTAKNLGPVWRPGWLRPPVKAACIPQNEVTDDLFGDSWGLSQPSDIDVDAEDAWADCAGDDEAVAAVLDSGVDPDHPDLAGNVVLGTDYTSECSTSDCDGSPVRECDRHGTGVAGVLASVANDIGTLGLAPRVKILTIRIGLQYAYTVSDPDPVVRCQGLTYASWTRKGIEYAVQQGVLVTNLSWNWGQDPVDPIADAYRIAYDTGIVNINSAGNNNHTYVHFPGNMAEVLSVSGIQIDGTRMYVRETFASNIGLDVAIAAPAQDILTTDLLGGLGDNDGSGTLDDAFAVVTGTSFAAPLVAAAAVLVRLQNPTLGPSSVELVLRSSAVDYGPPGRDDTYGDGLLNANNAGDLAPQVVFASGFETGRLSDWSLAVQE